MKQIGILWALLLTLSMQAQNKVNVNTRQPAEEFDNIYVEKLNSDSLASSFLIWVKHRVKAHKHEKHTENLYVVSGKAKMRVGDRVFEISAGDYFQVPMNTVHSVEVTSDEPLKVVSVQSPEFLGKDRVFVEE